MQVIKSANGKRFALDGKKAADVAFQTGLSESSAKALMRGRAVSNWGIVEMQRRREPMIIRYRLTSLGRQYRDKASGKVCAFLSFCADWTEASDLSEKMLRAGFSDYCRLRCLQEAAGLVKRGLLEKDKRSGAIFGNL